MQQDVNLRTEQLRKAIGAVGKPAEPQQLVCDLLGRQQQRLGEQTRQLQKLVESEDKTGRLTSIARQMQAAGSRIRQADVGAGTQDVQRRVVADLDQVIADALKSAAQAPSNGSPSQQAGSRPPVDHSQPKPDTAGEPKPGEKPGNKPAAENKARAADGGLSHKAEGGEVRGMMKQLWGQLPQHAHQQMLQSPVEELSPKYKQAIEEYFRRLAEEPPAGIAEAQSAPRTAARPRRNAS